MSDPVLDAMNAMAAERGESRADLEATGLVKVYGDRTVVNGMDVRCSCGEIVGDTLIIHIEKADIEFDGAYQKLVSEYAKMYVTESVQYINREEDLGDPGMRQSKENYHPVKLLEKYLVKV